MLLEKQQHCWSFAYTSKSLPANRCISLFCIRKQVCRKGQLVGPKASNASSNPLTCEMKWLSFICLSQCVCATPYRSAAISACTVKCPQWPGSRNTTGEKGGKTLQRAQTFPLLNFCSGLVCKLFHLWLHHILALVGICRLKGPASCIDCKLGGAVVI